jgi:hypothetical protein
MLRSLGMIGSINVFAVINGEFVCYQCFLAIHSGRYGVLKKVIYPTPVSIEQVKRHEETYFSSVLYAEDNFMDTTYPTLEQALLAYEERTTTFFRDFDIWKRISDNCVDRYRCFEILPNQGFCVQSRDRYCEYDFKKNQDFLERNFLELISDLSPLDRSSISSTIEGAIIAFEQSF